MDEEMYLPSEFWRTLLAFLLCGCYQKRRRRKYNSNDMTERRRSAPQNSRRNAHLSSYKNIFDTSSEKVYLRTGAKQVSSVKNERPNTNPSKASPKDWDLFSLKKFCEMSKDGGIQWLDTSLRKIMQIIENAILKDSLKPIDNNVSYTSSAVDTMTLFYQLKDAAYEHINSDNIRDTYVCISKLIDDFCKCVTFYVDEMFKKIRKLEEISHITRPFRVTPELCIAINSSEYLHDSIAPFIEKMSLDNISRTMQLAHSEAFVKRWHNNLKNIVHSAEDSIKQKIFAQLEFLVEQMEPTIKKLLLEDIANFKAHNHHDRLLEYLSQNVLVMHIWLKTEHFEYVLLCIWNSTSTTSHCFLNDSKKTLRPKFYKNMAHVLQGLQTYLKDLDGKKSIAFSDVRDVLAPQFVTGSREHIHHYHLERLDQQHSLTSVGVISVKIYLINQVLQIEILNTRDIILPRKNSNGTCNPYIKLCLLPKEKFKTIKKFKTKAQKNTFYPIFDETFYINLTTEQLNINNALIQFTLKNQSIFKINGEFIGESFFPLCNIQSIQSKGSLGNVEQRLLKLTRPISTGCCSYQILRESKSEKAKKFIKKEKLKQTC